MDGRHSLVSDQLAFIFYMFHVLIGYEFVLPEPSSIHDP